MKKIISQIVTDYFNENHKIPNFVEYFVGDKQLSVFIVIDINYTDMEIEGEKLAFWIVEDDDDSIYDMPRSHVYYEQFCPQRIKLGTNMFDLEESVVQDNTIYAKYSRYLSPNDYGLDKLVLSRTYDEEIMAKFKRHVSKIEWNSIEEEQGRESFEVD